MARHDDADWVVPIRQADGAKRCWCSDLTCDLAVRPRLTVGNGQQRLPHLPLKCCADEVQINVEFGQLTGEVRLQLVDCLRERVVVGYPAVTTRLVGLV